MTRDEALRKVASLLKLANSSNANEAALAAQRAQEIMAKFQLDSAMLNLDGDEPKPDEAIVDFGAKDAPLYAEGQRKSTWMVRLAYHVARANGCRVYLRGPSIHLVGRPSDADTVRYLFAYLTREVDRLTDRDGKGCGQTWRNNFRLGVVETIAEKLREAQRVVNEAARAEARASINPHALVRVNSAIERVEQRSASVQAWMDTNMKLNKGRPTTVTLNHGGREAGRKAGQEIHVGGQNHRVLGDRARMLGA